MYHAPAAERTEAWKPCGVRSARIDAVGSSTPLPVYVLISGCFAASSGAIRVDSRRANRCSSPFGAGSETIVPPAEPLRGRRRERRGRRAPVERVSAELLRLDLRLVAVLRRRGRARDVLPQILAVGAARRRACARRHRDDHCCDERQPEDRAPETPPARRRPNPVHSSSSLSLGATRSLPGGRGAYVGSSIEGKCRRVEVGQRDAGDAARGLRQGLTTRGRRRPCPGPGRTAWARPPAARRSPSP